MTPQRVGGGAPGGPPSGSCYRPSHSQAGGPLAINAIVRPSATPTTIIGAPQRICTFHRRATQWTITADRLRNINDAVGWRRRTRVFRPRHAEPDIVLPARPNAIEWRTHPKARKPVIDPGNQLLEEEAGVVVKSRIVSPVSRLTDVTETTQQLRRRDRCCMAGAVPHHATRRARAGPSSAGVFGNEGVRRESIAASRGRIIPAGRRAMYDV